MEIEEARALLADNHRSVLHTARSDGSPQLSPVVHAVDGEGRVCISTRETSMKVKNLRRRPRAALCGLSDGFFGNWVQIDGPVEIVPLPEAMEGLKDVYRAVAGEHPDWEEFEAAMVKEQRVVVRITIERAGPQKSG
ncbi:MAG: PPOX class F420-dependent oxidoreductase [Actinobacteria bacterium]|nr:PPOX class F420-dependent oxidoreductase [Actinomycetota bacterium]MBW3649145.1 PPOX class F420-dependent oxidoreductase [Actinomycetota bacterium]